MTRIPSSVSDVFLNNSSEESTEQPNLKRIEGDTAIQDAKGGYVGQVCYCPTYDCQAYWSPRTHEDHYYHIGDAYPLDIVIIEELQTEYDNVEKVFIGEREERQVFELEFQKYVDGEFIHHDGQTRQRYAPFAEADEVWEDALDAMRPD